MLAGNPTPSFFTKLNTYERSRSYDGSPSGSAETSDNEAEASDAAATSASAGVRRAVSMRVPGRADHASHRGIEGLSFTAAGATLRPDAPLASRHALFSHHRVASTSSAVPVPISASPEPPSSPSSTSSAFSPASAFLSRFSSHSSVRPTASSSATPDGPGAVVLGYTLGKVLGRGGFSTVRLATNAKGEQYACKIVKRDDLSDRSGSLEKFEEEIRILKSLARHPSLLPLLEMDRTDYATFLITPAMLGGNLLDVLRREGGSDRTARKWVKGIVDAVAAMHLGYEGFAGGMLHGDLKLDNFLVDHDGRVVVCDFYMAQIITEHSVPPPTPRPRPRQTLPTHLEPLPLPAHFPSASLPYAPPELLSHPPAPPSLAQDIWALGVCLYALLTGKLPFVDAFDPRLQMKILRGQWDIPDHLGREWLDLLHGCLDGNRGTRWTIEQVRNSDAVIGWAEVKQRSRSRSRRRVDEWADPLTSRPRDGRSASRGGGGGRRDESRGTIRAKSTNRLDPEDIGFDHLHVRGRSSEVIPGLSFARESRPTSTTRTPSAKRDGSRSARSRSNTRQPPPPMPISPTTSFKTVQRQAHSPTNSLSLNIGEGQRSRSRGPGTALGVVDEEVTERGRRGRR